MNFAMYRLFLLDLTKVHITEGLLLLIRFLTHLTAIKQESLIHFLEHFRQRIIWTVCPRRYPEGVLMLAEARWYGLQQNDICTYLSCLKTSHANQSNLRLRAGHSRQIVTHKQRNRQKQTA